MVKGFMKLKKPSRWMRQAGLQPLRPKSKNGLRDITGSRTSNRPLSSPEKERPLTGKSGDDGIRESKSRGGEMTGTGISRPNTEADSSRPTSASNET